MAYDTRWLLHYFRLMPNRQSLFRMRGCLFSTDRSEAAMQKLIVRDFHAMFPAWKSVKIQYFWTGMVCMTRHQIPFIGAIPNLSGSYAGFGYNGTGVAMASYVGAVSAPASGSGVCLKYLQDLQAGGLTALAAPHLNPNCASHKMITKTAIMMNPAPFSICNAGNSLKNTYSISSENNMAVYSNGATTKTGAKR